MKIINGIKMFTTTEISELLGITTTSVANKRKKGLLPSVMIGHRIYTSEQALSDYLNGVTTERLRREKAEAQQKQNENR